ncbi:hypothetical protein AMAG_19189 [Allomyces macrogynus ATCC 38327]|uniref:Uncharacterized protein n=1 Tax=Allomyces macrogynus (strain ATCC 38327) TaxID=578462 RepID=A0A0L0STA0_ALLM3|nr:hypothetical protein AMAG_19189 [Allomyces macrogynus ATCC 38327]|eukprot:KNE65610.1 hypothetical protein AMAG_19189 [Allomyces macrogynus ATCC 38327]
MHANISQGSSTTTATSPPRFVQYAYTVRGGTPLARTWSVAGVPSDHTLLVPIASIIETLLAPGVPMIDDSRIADVAERVTASSLQMLAGSDRLAYLKWTRGRQLAQLQGGASLFRRDEVGRAKPPTLRVPQHTGGAVALVAVEDVGQVAPPSDDTDDNDDDIVFPSLPFPPHARARGSSSTPTPASIAAARRSVPAWIRRLQDEGEDSDSDVEYEGIASTAVSSSDESEAADPMDVDDFSLTQVVDSISSQPLQMGPLHPVMATPALDAAGALVRMRRSGGIIEPVVTQQSVDETEGMLAAVDRDEWVDERGDADMNDGEVDAADHGEAAHEIDAEAAAADAPFWSTDADAIAELGKDAPPPHAAPMPEPAADIPR